MEMGVEIENKPRLGETVAVEDGISDFKVGDRGVRGFHQSKDSEGDVFEEAVDAHLEEIPVPEQSKKLDLEEVIVNGHEYVDKTRDSDSLEVSGISNGEQEIENFEEAIEPPGEDQSQEEEQTTVVEKIEDLVAPEPVDEVVFADRGGDVEAIAGKVVPVESNRLEEDGLVGSGEADVKEVSAMFADGAGDVEAVAVEVVRVESNRLDGDGLIGNGEADVKEISAMFADGAGDVEAVAVEVVPVKSNRLDDHGLIGNGEADVKEVSAMFADGAGDVEAVAVEVVHVESNRLDGDGLIGNGEADVKEVSAMFADGAGDVRAVAVEVVPVKSNRLDDHGLIGNGEADVKEVSAMFADGAGDVEAVAVEVVPVESNRLDDDGLIGNGEEDVKEVSAVDADGDAKPLMDGKGAERRSDQVPELSENGDLDNLNQEETPAVHQKLENGNVDKLSDEIELSQGSESNELKVSLEETPVAHEKSENGNVVKAESDEIELSQGSESNKLIMHEDNDSGEFNNSSTNLDRERQDHLSLGLKNSSSDQDTFVNKKTKTLDESLPPSEDSTTEINEEIKDDAAVSEANDSQDSRPPCADGNIKEGANGHPEVEEPKEQQTQNEGQKHSLVGNKEPEIQPAGNIGSSAGNPTNPAPPRPAGLGGAAPLLEPAPRALQQPRVNGTVPQRQAQVVEDPMTGEAEENDETREKLQMIRVKFLRLAHRLGQTPHNVVVAQVLYRLGLAEQLRGRNASRAGAFSFDRASAMAEQLEAAGQDPLDFSCTIMVIGKTGVGKSATINSIFDEVKFTTDAFHMGTKKVQDVVGTVQGIKVRVIDTPGLLPSWSDQRQNEKILHSVKRFIKKTPPDIVLYLDRLDMQSRDFGDMPLLRTITDIFGPSIWFNAIVVLTHAASAPPEGPNGTASSYEMFVTQRSHVVQQAIRQAAGDMRLMNPVSLVENHSACRTNRAGQRVLPNGQVWKPHLLLLSFASKILAEANTLLKLQDSPPGKPFTTRSRAPSLPLLLSSLLQSRPQPKLPEEQFGDDEDALDEDLDEASDSDEGSDYDELPPFKRLSKVQLAKLSKAQRKAYFDELEYREKLFMKKQLKEERKRRKLLKKMAASAKDLPNDYNENIEEESGGAASVPVPMPDLALPVSFDSDNPTHRYRYLDSSNQWLVRPVLETHGWDHDVGYEGINAERLFVVKDKIPLSFSGQVTKDKKETNVQMELASSIKHGEGKASSLGFDMQTVGKDMAYTLRSETRFSNFRHNKTAAGLSITLLGDALSAGVKLEDKLIVNKRFRLVMTGGAMTGRGDVAYGGSLEATLRDKDYPLGRTLSTLGLSIMDWHGDLAIGCNVQSQLPIGRATNMIARANLNNRGAGQVSIRFNSSEQLQIALVALLPLFRKLLGYSQQLQFGQ